MATRVETGTNNHRYDLMRENTGTESPFLSPRKKNDVNPSDQSPPQRTRMPAITTTHAKKSVRFDSDMKVFLVSKHQRNKAKLWYSEREIEDMRRGLLHTMQLVSYISKTMPEGPALQSFLLEDGRDPFDRRGTECMTEEGRKRRDDIVRCVKMSVLTAQRLQREEKGVIFNPTAVALASAMFSQKSQQEAIALAKDDASEARAYCHSKCRRSTVSTPNFESKNRSPRLARRDSAPTRMETTKAATASTTSSSSMNEDKITLSDCNQSMNPRQFFGRKLLQYSKSFSTSKAIERKKFAEKKSASFG